MTVKKRAAAVTGGIVLVGLFFTWLGARDALLAVVALDETGRLLLHGVAWLGLIGGVSLLAVVIAAKKHH